MVRISGKALMALFCGVIMMPAQMSCLLHSHLLKISGAVTIDDRWTEIRPSPPLKAQKDFQLVLLELDPPFKYDFDSQGTGPERGDGVLTPQGETINPTIEIVDQYGKSFNLVYKGATGVVTSSESPVYGTATDSEKLPQDRDYTMVRMKSRLPIKCRAVYWFCESTKDWK